MKERVKHMPYRTPVKYEYAIQIVSKGKPILMTFGFFLFGKFDSPLWKTSSDLNLWNG